VIKWIAYLRDVSTPIFVSNTFASFGHLDILPITPDVKDRSDLISLYGWVDNDEEAIQEIGRDTMGRPVACAMYGRDSSISCNDKDMGHLILQCMVEEGETLNVEHVYFINEESTRDDFSLPFLTPPCHLCINLSSLQRGFHQCLL